MTNKHFILMCYRHYFFLFKKVSFIEWLPMICIGLFIPVIAVVIKKDFENHLKQHNS